MTNIMLTNGDEAILQLQDWKRQYGITAGMTSRLGGVSNAPYASLNVGLHVGDDDEKVIENRAIVAKQLGFPLHKWVVGEQTHQTNLYKALKGDAGKGAMTRATAISNTDGLYTKETRLLLVSLYADCVPLYYYDHTQRTVGIVHAGWRGTVNRIAKKMVEQWQGEGHDPKNIQIVIGPSIGDCCYEVNEQVISHLEGKWLREVKVNNNDGTYMLDLKLLNKLLLREAGIPERSITLSQLCTSCSNTSLFSHRKERNTGRMMAYIGID